MRKILVVIDMQNDFISGVLGTNEAQAIVVNVVRKIAQYPAGDVFATQDTHGDDYLETQEGRLLPIVHCIRGTSGWAFEDAVATALTGATVVEKPTFGSTRLAHILAEENKQEPLAIELVGVCTDICVVSNALLLKATLPEAAITVDSACCAGATPEKHRAALETMQSCQIRVV